MGLKRKKPVQTCRSCGKTGHNRRRCPSEQGVLASAKPVSTAPVLPQVTPTSVPKKSTLSQPKRGVMVHHVEEALSSPHVVTLAKKHHERKEAIARMPVYHETTPVAAPRRTVDFAALIREAQHATPSERAVALAAPRVRRESGSARLRRRVSSAVASGLSAPRRLADHVSAKATKLQTFNLRAAVSVGVILSLLLSAPMPVAGYYQHLRLINNEAVSAGTRGFLALKSSTEAALAANLPQAKSDLATALQAFDSIDRVIGPGEKWLLSAARFLPVVGSAVSSRERLLSAGQHVALGNAYFVKGIDDAGALRTQSVTNRLSIIREHMVSAIPQYEAALTDLSAVDPDVLPEEEQQTFRDVRMLFAAFVHDLKELSHLSETLSTVLGNDDFRRYLVVFQNSHELRPTGGFVGSLAVVDVEKGKIVNIEVPPGGPYDLSGQLPVSVKPPLPLQMLNSRWELQDANWFPHFPASAEKLSWFYRLSRGQTVDGVIAINSEVLEKFLGVVGPVELAEFQMTLTEQNALHTIQEQVEDKYDKEENKPKAVIGALVQQLIEQSGTLSSEQVVRLGGVLHQALAEKDIQIFLTDPAGQARLREFGWTGELATTGATQDYLMVVNANIRSQKSDAKITQEITHQAVVEADGSVVDTVIIKRTHTGTPGEAYYGGTNLSYVRAYVPAGSTLLSAGGFSYPPEEAFRTPAVWATDDTYLLQTETEIAIDKSTGTRVTSEFGKTAFGNWLSVQPGESVEAFFVYRLPFRVTDEGVAPATPTAPWSTLFGTHDRTATARYSVLIQKQSGSVSSIATAAIFPDGFSPVWKSGDELILAKNGASLSAPLIEDIVLGVLMQQTVQP